MKYPKLAAAAVSAVFLLLTACGSTAQSSEPADTLHSADLFAMDTIMSLKAYGSGGEAALTAAEARITELEQTLSVTDENSDLWAIDHAAGAPTTVSADTAAILDMAERVSAESGGALCISLYPVLREWGFTTGEYHVPETARLAELLPLADDTKIVREGNTVTIPEDAELDLGALAKGYTSDSIMDIMRENGVASAIISLGGNVQALGEKPDGSPWKVGITNPFAPDQNLGVLEIRDCAVITSGNYERYFTDDDGNTYWHILDPTDGYPADNGLVSVTVIGKSGLRCDALSTALFVEGTENAVAHWRNSAAEDFELVLVTDDAKLLVTEGIAGQFSNDSGMHLEVITREEA